MYNNDKIAKSTFFNTVILGGKMKILKLKIKGIGGIQNLDLNFSDGFNVICGANGIGKTTILNVIAYEFSQGNSLLTRNSMCEKGIYTIDYYNEGGERHSEHTITDFIPKEKNYLTLATNTKSLLRFNVNRNFEYMKLDVLSPDSTRDEFFNSKVTFEGVSVGDLKNWFINRFAFHDKENSLSKNEITNYNLAKKMFSVLDETITFKTVLSKSFDIILSTTKGDIYFEYLSAGYKSCLYIIMGIMKEIEYRYTDTPILIGDFEGCILIDEIEEHLHPSWQARLISALKEIFPKCQFIITTHSPSILQCLTKKEIIPLCLDKNGNTSLKELEIGEYGLQGWTLEEILQDVMEMPGTTSNLYKSVISDFDKAMDEENITEIKKNYEILDKILHPKSTLRKLLQIQMAGLKE